jgi:hypothetical protein
LISPLRAKPKTMKHFEKSIPVQRPAAARLGPLPRGSVGGPGK